MDARLYLSVNHFVAAHAEIGRIAAAMEKWAVPLFAFATVALWLFDRPGGTRKWKLASASALASAGLALLVAQVVTKVWARPRPFVAHPTAHVWGARSTDPSFPSDHASTSLAIAFTILMFDRLVGSIFVAAAVLVSFGRVVVGAHYPLDVVGGALVALGSALLVVRLARPGILSLVRIVERVTDPIVAPFWRRLAPRSRAART